MQQVNQRCDLLSVLFQELDEVGNHVRRPVDENLFDKPLHNSVQLDARVILHAV
jgi:hypothetical protein